MDSAQKRDRDRKNRQKRQDKEARRKERTEQKLQRGSTPDTTPIPPDLNSPEFPIEREPRTGT